MSSNLKKRKRNVVLHQAVATLASVDTSKPTAVFQPTTGRSYTLSIALPGSVIANAQTYDLKIALAGQIARAASVFCVDEIVIFDDGQSWKAFHRPTHSYSQNYHLKNAGFDQSSYADQSEPDQFLYHVLSYLETPPHLRRTLFPMHPDLKGAGMLPSLDMPHHLRPNEWCQYREGVTVDPSANPHATSGDHSSPTKRQKKSPKNALVSANENAAPTFVDCGLSSPIPLSLPIPPTTRVTLKFSTPTAPPSFPVLSEADIDSLDAEAVDPSAPREEAGYYWGYTARRCSSLSAVFTECPFNGGYDYSIGTSERGIAVSSLTAIPPVTANGDGSSAPAAAAPLSKFQHLILVFGGVAGLEAAVAFDTEFEARGITKDKANEVFDAWVNLVPGQGSRTIRTEEAVWVGLMGLRELVVQNGSDGALYGKTSGIRLPEKQT